MLLYGYIIRNGRMNRDEKDAALTLQGQGLVLELASATSPKVLPTEIGMRRYIPS